MGIFYSLFMYLVYEKNEKIASLKVSTKRVFVKKRGEDIESASMAEILASLP